MGLFSIFPQSLAVVETWITRAFLFLGIVTIGPWAVMLIYDLILYLFRTLTYKIPVVGGRARGKARPRAPSLTERPIGSRRRFSLARRPDGPPQSTGEERKDASDARFRHIVEKKHQDPSAT